MIYFCIAQFTLMELKGFPEILETKRLRLRPLQADDESFISLMFTHPEINKYMGDGPMEKEDALALFQKAIKIHEIFPERVFMIRVIEHQGKRAGYFELKQTRFCEDDELEIIFSLLPEHWGKGFIPELVKEVNSISNSLGKTIIATIYRENKRSYRVFEKLGIEKEFQATVNGDSSYKIVVKRAL